MHINPAIAAEVDSWLTVLQRRGHLHHVQSEPDGTWIVQREWHDRPLDPSPPGPRHGLGQGPRLQNPAAEPRDELVTSDDPAVTTVGPQRDPTTNPGGASYRVRRSYGPSFAPAPASEGEGSPAGPRARAHGDQPGNRHQGAPFPPEASRTEHIAGEALLQHDCVRGEPGMDQGCLVPRTEQDRRHVHQPPVGDVMPQRHHGLVPRRQRLVHLRKQTPQALGDQWCVSPSVGQLSTCPQASVRWVGS